MKNGNRAGNGTIHFNTLSERLDHYMSEVLHTGRGVDIVYGERKTDEELLLESPTVPPMLPQGNLNMIRARLIPAKQAKELLEPLTEGGKGPQTVFKNFASATQGDVETAIHQAILHSTVTFFGRGEGSNRTDLCAIVSAGLRQASDQVREFKAEQAEMRRTGSGTIAAAAGLR